MDTIFRPSPPGATRTTPAGLDVAAVGKAATALAYSEDADRIGSGVGNRGTLAGGIDTDLVGMGHIPAEVGSALAHGKLLLL